MSLAEEGDPEAQNKIPIPSFYVTTGMDYTLTGYINGIHGHLLVDNSAATTLLARTVWDRAKTSSSLLDTPVKTKLIGVQGNPTAQLR